MKVDPVIRLINPSIPHLYTSAAWKLINQVSPRIEMNQRSVSRVVHLEMVKLWEMSGAREDGVLSWRQR